MKSLIVEDEKGTAAVLQRLLSKFGTCIVAENGNEALRLFEDEYIKKARFDLVCLDIMLPDISGRELLVELRAIDTAHGNEGLDSTKVIMVTGQDSSDQILGSFKDGCEGYLVKPIERESLETLLYKLEII